jgi:endonuclease YncB( thermonuclease family)
VNGRAATLLLLISPLAGAGEISGRAHVLDGDSLRIGRVEIRLHGIDAPEGRQTCMIDGREWACGRSARRALIQLVGTATVHCTWAERDTYKRALATCFIDGADINAQLVASGMALAYTRYSDRYVRDEALARSKAIGLWRSKFVAPWVWRRADKAASKRR